MRRNDGGQKRGLIRPDVMDVHSNAHVVDGVGRVCVMWAIKGGVVGGCSHTIAFGEYCVGRNEKWNSVGEKNTTSSWETC